MLTGGLLPTSTEGGIAQVVQLALGDAVNHPRRIYRY